MITFKLIIIETYIQLYYYEVALVHPKNIYAKNGGWSFVFNSIFRLKIAVTLSKSRKSKQQSKSQGNYIRTKVKNGLGVIEVCKMYTSAAVDTKAIKRMVWTTLWLPSFGSLSPTEQQNKEKPSELVGLRVSLSCYATHSRRHGRKYLCGRLCQRRMQKVATARWTYPAYCGTELQI